MTIKLNEAEGTHKELCGPLLTLFMKKPELTFVEAHNTYGDSAKLVANIFDVHHNLDIVGKIGYRNGKLFIESKRIQRERKPINEFRTVNPKALIRKGLEVFVPEEVDKVVSSIMEDTTTMVEDVRYGAYRKLPDIDNREVLSFLCDYKNSDTRIPIPAGIDAKLTDTCVQNVQDFSIVKEMQNLAHSKRGYALREEINNHITVVNMRDNSIVYRGSSTYDLPEWMQSKVTILKLLEKNQAARNIGCKGVKYGHTYYFIVDGEIPDLIE